MKFNLSTLASGSSGNCNLVTFGNTNLMIDCGISLKSILNGLSTLGKPFPDALLITHSHGDHVKSLLPALKKFDVPVFITKPTRDELKTIPEDYANYIIPGISFCFNGIDIKPFQTYHDTSSPVGFTFSSGVDKVSVLTDTGRVDDAMYEEICFSSSVIIESNFDKEMLFSGPYPYFLKKRISGAYGHLENSLCADICSRLLADGTTAFLLAHLSDKNNTPDIAFQTTENKLCTQNKKYILKTASRYTPTVL